MTGTVRLLTQDERKALEPIEKSHGITFSGGSCVTENGKDTFWLSFDARLATKKYWSNSKKQPVSKWRPVVYLQSDS